MALSDFALCSLLFCIEVIATSNEYDAKSGPAIDKSQWVDPGDMMNFDIIRNEMHSLDDSRDIHSQTKYYDTELELMSTEKPSNCNNDMILSYLKQFIAKLALKMDVELDNKSTEKLLMFDATLLIDEKFTYVLRKFRSQDRISIHSLQETFDEILEIMKNVRKREYVSEQASAWVTATDFFRDNLLILQVLQLSLILSFLTVKLIGCSFKRIFFYCLCLAFLSSFVITWIRLCYEKSAAQSGQLFESLTSNRKDNDWKSFFTRPFKSFFSFGPESQITKLEKAKIHPALHVTPLKALSVTISEAILAPSQILGQNLALFFTALLNEMPGVIWLPMLIFTGIICLACLFFFCGYKMSAFYGLLRFEPSNQNERVIEAIGKSIKNVASDVNCVILNHNQSETKNLKLRCKSFSDLRFIERSD
uniref:Chloride channel CLIC-like protein 1 n=1 Tax=Romanomermis culicivorax TaxID=13658 RepID=A0A915K3Y0_ROMCU